MWFNRNAGLDSLARLMADIRINEDMSVSAVNLYVWNPMGASSSKAYTGVFDGGGHTISGVYVGQNGNNAGLFGYVSGGSIRNLSLSDSLISGTGNYVGGIVGQIGESGVISQCINMGEVKGSESVGGIAGSCSKGEIRQCVNKGLVRKADSLRVGGIVGDMTNYAIVTAVL